MDKIDGQHFIARTNLMIMCRIFFNLINEKITQSICSHFLKDSAHGNT